MRKPSFTGTCANEDCNGKLVWGDGTEFDLAKSGLDSLTANSSPGWCFRYKTGSPATVDEQQICWDGPSGGMTHPNVCIVGPKSPFML